MISERDLNIYMNKVRDSGINPAGNWAIYGTGTGAELAYTVLCRLSCEKAVRYVIERDERALPDREFHGIPVKKLSEICDSLEGIMIAALDHHELIKERICKSLSEPQLKQIRIVDIFAFNTQREKAEYTDYLEGKITNEHFDFVKFSEQEYSFNGNDTKLIAWYLPQFHQIEINNKYYGQGFTEWTNTSKTLPVFVGHYQPHIPYDVGYYDLMNPETLKRQIYLAKHYGIYGFCFHYYWFSGKRLMEKPLEMFLGHKELDMPFCISWATENWTALWDGGNKEVMLEQRLKGEDDKAFMEDMIPYMKDLRYIKIDGKPVLVIYRVNQFQKERIREMLNNFRKAAKENGFSDLYIMLTNAFDFEEEVEEWGADALVEFPPHVIRGLLDEWRPPGYLNPHFNGKIYDVLPFIKSKKYMLDHKAKTYFRAALTSWDNTARKATSGGTVFYGFTPQTFYTWLSDVVWESKRIHSKSEDIVFLNSWNEWGEGSHLEPDLKYGYAYLQMVKDVLEEQRKEFV